MAAQGSQTERSFGQPRLLGEGWQLRLTPAGAHAHPDTLPDDAGDIPGLVPGTAAAALEAAGRFDRTAPRPLHDVDVWYRIVLDEEPPGDALLRFEGLATLAEVFLNGDRILSSDSMFLSHDLPVSLQGGDQLAICFRALAPEIAKKGPRARWRPQMITPAGVRLKRTTLLGFMPGWCPEIHAVGPWRPISLARPVAEPIADDVRIESRLGDDGTGYLHISFLARNMPGPLRVRCAGVEAQVNIEPDGRSTATMTLPAITPWWPHTHGIPALHAIDLITAAGVMPLGRTGFRRIEVDRQQDGNGFSLKINGEPVFCRGAVWTSADIVHLSGSREDYAPWLKLAIKAHMNMIRIGGTMAYETPEFFALCDELGFMVWQDCMLANFDYPAGDETFLANIKTEIGQFLGATRASPSLTVFCGGSEVYQQAAMLGLPETVWKGPLTEIILPEIVAAERPDIVYVPNSPSGGAMPFSPNAGITHYYGVGAYCRPLEDARRANVRFAAECLAFAHVPQQQTLTRHLDVAPVHDPLWKARVPRDRGASWDFEDIREHYLQDLYGFDPARLRREDRARYLDLSRAVTGEVMEATFAEWRRHGSTCGGALVWTFQDLLPGAGWGIVDATGLPKPAWHALRRAFRPIQVALTDEGTNGLDVHLINETASEQPVRIELSCLRGGQQQVVGGSRDLVLAPRSNQVLPATALFGAFFDTTYAFRFGPPSHDVTVARLLGAETGESLAEAFHFPLGRAAAFHDAAITAQVEEDEEGWHLQLTANRLAQSVHIDADGFLPSDDWFHLAPGKPRIIRMERRNEGSGPPSGEITSVGCPSILRF
ncbi:glycoside hydrolase family 2 protein [Rhizobium sp. Root482]|uniref:glycoside hydrolase family 2 protein n=1 Tax=Rhizobium sp. Root482 TaxID=1736543 RepID=UPI0006FF56E2|nr:glycoside hydrolase family 2 protein [Rhizobium sp. Root482]KQY27149.1 beta-mannosidase [Rhizobium sp. Root482]